jgi:hypothetical protein
LWGGSVAAGFGPVSSEPMRSTGQGVHERLSGGFMANPPAWGPTRFQTNAVIQAPLSRLYSRRSETAHFPRRRPTVVRLPSVPKVGLGRTILSLRDKRFGRRSWALASIASLPTVAKARQGIGSGASRSESFGECCEMTPRVSPSARRATSHTQAKGRRWRLSC